MLEKLLDNWEKYPSLSKWWYDIQLYLFHFDNQISNLRLLSIGTCCNVKWTKAQHLTSRFSNVFPLWKIKLECYWFIFMSNCFLIRLKCVGTTFDFKIFVVLNSNVIDSFWWLCQDCRSFWTIFYRRAPIWVSTVVSNCRCRNWRERYRPEIKVKLVNQIAVKWPTYLDGYFPWSHTHSKSNLHK